MRAKEDQIDDTKMPLLDHLIELRKRLMYAVIAFFVCFVVCYHFASHIFDFLMAPLARILGEEEGRRMIYTGLTEAFFTNVRLGAWGALCVSFPFIASQLWMFVAPGLYKSEKQAFLPFLVATPVLFFAGAALVYYLIIPQAWAFFLSFQTSGTQTSLPIQYEGKIDQYLSLMTSLIFAFGLSFELPVLLTLLARVGIVSSVQLTKFRRYAIVGAFVFAAIVTPPDMISQIGLAIPLLILYEISIWTARAVERDRAKRAAEDEREEAGAAAE